ncbi:esterase-like activity of phytase family protein [Actinomadura sediminis]|uniref:Esterase-like activity of phytase family protein n=1 Tax=Actinomadura sediminis TaxID=1038904 RepID=A0ABW3F154_9ACTN
MDDKKVLRGGAVLAAALLVAGPAPGAAAAAPAAGPEPRAGAGAQHADAAPGVRISRFLGERRLPHKPEFEGTTVGGLSGMDRDPRTGTWYFISDDRWRYDPARFYTGHVDIDPRTGAFSGVRISGVRTLQRPDGGPYPGFGEPGSADPEAIRFDPRGNRLLWGNEGDRPDAAHPGIALSPLSVQWAGTDGGYRGALPLPANLEQTAEDRGPRRNYGFEAVAVAPHRIAAMAEGPRYEDGVPPTAERGAPVRLTLWNRDGDLRAQHAYRVEPLPAAPVPADGDADSGVSEILAIDDHRYLALERSWMQGVGYRVRLYAFDVRGATDVLRRDRLDAPYRPVSKRLVADLGRYADPTQNLEAMAWGPRLRTGERTLLIGSDDNFDEREVTQFLAFAVRAR